MRCKHQHLYICRLNPGYFADTLLQPAKHQCQFVSVLQASSVRCFTSKKGCGGGRCFPGNSLTWNEGKGITDGGLVFRVVSYPLLGAADRPPMSEAGKLKAGYNTEDHLSVKSHDPWWLSTCWSSDPWVRSSRYSSVTWVLTHYSCFNAVWVHVLW